MKGELLTEDRQEVNVPARARVRLRFGDTQSTAGKVDIAPAQRQELANSKSREDKRRQNRAARGVRSSARYEALERHATVASMTRSCAIAAQPRGKKRVGKPPGPRLR